MPGDGLRVRARVVTSNSKVSYLISPGKDGEEVARIPVDGRATVASAILEFEGFAARASETGVWLVRPADGELTVLDVDWKAITGAGRLATNYRLEPGDRVYVGRSPRK